MFDVLLNTVALHMTLSRQTDRQTDAIFFIFKDVVTIGMQLPTFRENVCLLLLFQRTYGHMNITVVSLTFRHRASCILGQAFHYSSENTFYIFNQQIYLIAWPCIIDINNIDNQLDATIMAY